MPQSGPEKYLGSAAVLSSALFLAGCEGGQDLSMSRPPAFSGAEQVLPLTSGVSCQITLDEARQLFVAGQIDAAIKNEYDKPRIPEDVSDCRTDLRTCFGAIKDKIVADHPEMVPCLETTKGGVHRTLAEVDCKQAYVTCVRVAEANETKQKWEVKRDPPKVSPPPAPSPDSVPCGKHAWDMRDCLPTPPRPQYDDCDPWNPRENTNCPSRGDKSKPQKLRQK